MEHFFGGLYFHEEDGVISASVSKERFVKDMPITSARIAGANVLSHGSEKQAYADGSLRVKEFIKERDFLRIVAENADCRVCTTVEKKGGGLRVGARVRNISSRPIVLENVTVFNVTGFNTAGNDNTYLYRFYNSHHAECQPRRNSLDEMGLFAFGHRTFKRIHGVNAGSWSTKEELPQIIIENAKTDAYLMAQIESCGAWYWEIGEDGDENIYLSLSGGNADFTAWSKRLDVDEEYETPFVSVCVGDSLNGVLDNVTTYRRATLDLTSADEKLTTVFNEYMHLSWDSPDEKRTRNLAPIIAQTGVETYVIDCGWHDEVDGSIVYPYVGKWRESKARFPSGLRKTTDYIRSLGMKAGLWIEPEVLGIYSGEEYPNDAYILSGGEKKLVANRYFLDFSHREVQKKMSETLRRMIEEYGADYIKIDCNQDSGVGTEQGSFTRGEGLERTTNAFWEWLKKERKKYPNVIFESCASGGMRSDWKSMQVSSVTSTSDQVDYKKYPYVVGNMFSMLLPEQAGFWCYPVVDETFFGRDFGSHTATDEEVVMNVVNATLGRLHLASDLTRLTKKQFELVKQGVAYIKSLNEFKKTAKPYLPFGFTRFGEKRVAVGLLGENKLVLAVWNLGTKEEIAVPLKELADRVKNCEVVYPTNATAKISWKEDVLRVSTEENTAIIIEIAL